MEHLRITVDGKSYEVVVEKIGGKSLTPPSPTAPAVSHPASSVHASAPASAPPPAARPASPAASGDVLSPLAGIVQAIALGIGSAVKEGDEVITLEAMKMYTPIAATASGTISAIHVKVGDAVEEGQPLYTIS